MLKLRRAVAVGAIITGTSCQPADTTPERVDSPADTAVARVEARMDTLSVRREISAMMDSSAAAWNRGDLDAFMQDYLPGEAPTFVGPDSVTRGADAIRARYAERYFAPGQPRDSLSFEKVEVHPLAPDVAHVIAYYVLSRRDTTRRARRDSVVARGPTSLVMRKVEGRWRIAHDHSS